MVRTFFFFFTIPCRFIPFRILGFGCQTRPLPTNGANEVYAQERAHPLLPLGLTNLLDTKFVWEDGTAVMQYRDKGKWRTMTKFEIRNNKAYASQMQFEVLRRALWAQQAHPDTVFN